jgi:hypothetical protein
MSSYDRAIVTAAARLIAQAQTISPHYASGATPASDEELKRLLSAYSCHVEQFVFRSSSPAMLLPPIQGTFPILLNLNADPAQRALTIRHELAHVMGGDVDGAVFLADEGYMVASERVADLFALADLIPAGDLREIRPGAAAPEQVGAIIAAYAEGWPADRIRDRAGLRLLLHYNGSG